MSALIERRFETILGRLVDVISSIVDDVYDSGLTYYRSNAVDIANYMIELLDTSELIVLFARLHNSWDMIVEQDERFVTDLLCTNLDRLRFPVDGNLFALPFITYTSMKSCEKWKDVGEDDLPVNSKDLETLWYYYSAMAKIACEYVDRQMIDKVALESIDPELKTLYESIDTEKWRRLL